MSRRMDELTGRYPVLTPLQPKLEQAAALLIQTFERGHKVLLAGNGGSGSDCDHIAGELLKGFCSQRPLNMDLQGRLSELYGDAGRNMAAKLQTGLPAVNLGAAVGFSGAWANDVDAELVYAQHLLALGQAGDLFWGISTGGGAQNVLAALKVAKVLGVKTLLLTGAKHGVCEQYADLVLDVPETETFKIQELHLPVYHALCLAVEDHFFRK